MTRPRSTLSTACLTCRIRVFDSDVEMQRVSQHRMAHRRADHRREQWRAYRQRRAQREQGSVAGYLHEVACDGGHYARRHGCIPIPVFRRQFEEAS